MAKANRVKPVGENGRRVMSSSGERDCRFKVSSARREINAAERRKQSIQSYETERSTMPVSNVLAVNVGGNDEVFPLGMAASERPEPGIFKGVGSSLAFDGDGWPSGAGDHEIHFVAVFVPPVVNVASLQASLDLVEDKMLPESSRVFIS